jgi:DNA-binding transcriptional LysR family regulator
MHLKTLRVFCDVVRRRSFSRGAGENGISQSAASQMVSHLEERLGVKLIDRSKRPFVLTPEGEVYYEGCRALVERYQSLEERVRSLHQEVAGRVRVSSIYSIGLHHMSRYIQRFLARYPKANVRLEYLHPGRVYQNVERDVADLGLVSYPRASRSIAAIAWREEAMVVACAPTHPLARHAGQEPFDLHELQGLAMVSFDPGLSIRREIDRVLHHKKIDVQVVMEFDNIETIKRAIEIDAGVGILPQPTVVREVKAGTLVALPIDRRELVRPIGIIHRRGKELSVTARHFIEALQSEEFDEGAERLPATAAGGDAPAGAAADATSAATGDNGPRRRAARRKRLETAGNR